MQTETLLSSPISSRFSDHKAIVDKSNESIIQDQKPINQKIKSKLSKKVSRALIESKNELVPLESAAIPMTKNLDSSLEKSIDSSQSSISNSDSHIENKRRRNKRAIRKPGNLGSDFVCPMELDNMPKRPKKKRAVENNQEIIQPRIADPGIFCICKGIDDGIRPMIQCKTCEDWFHFDCIGISESNVPEEYLCPNCSNVEKMSKVSSKNIANSNPINEKKKMSGLDLLIFAIEQYESQSGRKLSTSTVQAKEKTLSSQDSDHSIDENKEIQQDTIKFDKKPKKSLSEVLSNSSQNMNVSKYFIKIIKTYKG